MDYSIEVQKERTGIYVNLSICDRVTAQNVKTRLSQEVVNVLASITSLDNISEADKQKLNALKSINQKIDYALKNPARPEVSLSGVIQSIENSLLLMTLNDGNRLLTTRTENELAHYVGQKVVVHGLANEDGSVEVKSTLPVKENTLELFIMSQCPFGLEAAEKLIAFKKQSKGKSPDLNIRYIFYSTPQGFRAMHGEEELAENVVQILIRDNHPKVFFNYLIKRIESESANWQQLAKEVGLANSDIRQLESSISQQSQQIIQREYEYVAGKNKISDGSPSYVWEGVEVSNIELISAFASINMDASGNCTN